VHGMMGLGLPMGEGIKSAFPWKWEWKWFLWEWKYRKMCGLMNSHHTIPCHVRLLHKFDKLQTYIKEMTKLDNRFQAQMNPLINSD